MFGNALHTRTEVGRKRHGPSSQGPDRLRLRRFRRGASTRPMTRAGSRPGDLKRRLYRPPPNGSRPRPRDRPALRGSPGASSDQATTRPETQRGGWQLDRHPGFGRETPFKAIAARNRRPLDAEVGGRTIPAVLARRRRAVWNVLQLAPPDGASNHRASLTDRFTPGIGPATTRGT
jgi:hypothetical protein